MVHVFYHVPLIPPIPSSVRYSHARAFTRYADRCTILTHEEPPSSIADDSEEVHLIDGSTLSTARRARDIVESAAETTLDSIHVTTFHYEAALGGYLSTIPWVVDLYDDPMQYALNSPRSHHELTARLLLKLLDRADGGLHGFHPAAPRAIGRDRRYILEGCPVSQIGPQFPEVDGPLRGVWAGSPRLDRGLGILLRALSQLNDEAIHVDVFGETDSATESLVHELGVEESLSFHGREPHERVLESITQSHLGFCVLPDRIDWQYATPVKVREYMAGGTIPVLSSFHGMRWLAERAGVYTEPDPTALASRLTELCGLSNGSLRERMERARERAEANPLATQREWFVKEALGAGLGTNSL